MNKQRDVGRIGEAHLRSWASEAGITTNKAEVDHGGWDFLLELPLGAGEDAGSSLPLDLSLQPIRALVQVKSTDKRKGFVSLKLSNWKRLTEVLLPAFYLIYEFEGERHPQRAFLVHVGATEIRRVKKRLRKTPPGERDELHNRSMRLTYDGRHRMSALGGDALQEAILSHTGSSPQEYAIEKRETLEKVGYEKSSISFKMLFDLPEDYGDDVEEYLMDFAIGLVPRIEAKRVELREVRFSIPSPEPVEEPGPGTLKLGREEVDRFDLTLSAEGIDDARFTAEIYHSSSLLGEDITEEAKVRFSIPFVDVTFKTSTPTSLNIQFDLPSEGEAVLLSDLYAFSRFVLFFKEEAEREVDMDISFDLPAGPSGRLERLKAYKIERLAEEDVMVEIATAIRNLWRVCQAFDVEQRVRTTLWEIEQQEQQLKVFYKLLQSSEMWAKLLFQAADDADLTRAENFGAVHLAGILAGEFRFVFLLGIVGKPDQTDEKELPSELREEDMTVSNLPEDDSGAPRYKLVSQDLRMLGKRMFPRGELPLPVEELKSKAAEELEEQGVEQIMIEE